VCWPEETGAGNPQASYYRARYYDPAIGRFLREDEVENDEGVDLYAYTTRLTLAIRQASID
jgi:RHS repeat-associated protein